MKSETWKKIAAGLGIAGIIGGAASLASNAIHMAKPETTNIPAEHAREIKRLVAETMREEAEKMKKG